MLSEIGNNFFQDGLITTHFPSPSLPVGVAPNPWIPFIMVMVTHIVPLECVHFDEYKADNVTLKHACTQVGMQAKNMTTLHWLSLG